MKPVSSQAVSFEPETCLMNCKEYLPDVWQALPPAQRLTEP